MSPKSILITGCSSGIGYATAQRLHRHGWNVIATCRKPEDVARLKQEGLTCLCLDVDDSASIQAAFAEALVLTQGTLNAFFGNAGYGQPGAVEDVPRAALRAAFETNVFGMWECIATAMRIFRAQGHGRILVNSSVLGFAAMPWRGAYNSSKFALEGLCDTLRHETCAGEIYVSLLQPGPIATRFRANALAQFQQHIDAQNSVHHQAYARQLARMQSEDKVGGFTLSADACAAVAERALNARRPKARYRVTLPTHAFALLKRLLPTPILDRLLRKAAA